MRHRRVRSLLRHPADPSLMQVPLANGRGVALIDAQDADAVGALNWSLTGNGYANAMIHTGEAWTPVTLHRFVARLAGIAAPTIDHINGDKLDNRRSNLRAATVSENLCNARVNRRNTSGVKGVSWDKGRRRWHAYLWLQRKRVQVGYFAELSDAESAVRAARERLHGEFARHTTDAR